MLDRIRRSFDLVQATGRILREDKHLLLFPVIATGALLLVSFGFILPVLGVDAPDGLHRGSRLVYSTAFLFYVVQYAIFIYFNTALVGAAMIRLDGGSPTLGDGLRVANRRLPAILGYAVISATVGVVLRAIQERVGFIGRLIVAFIGAGWAVATFLVVPVIVARERGPIESISESVDLLKRTWGENLVVQGGLGVAFSCAYLGLFGGTWLLIRMFMQTWFMVMLVGVLAFTAFVVLAVLHATLNGIYSAALYRYASGGATLGFDDGALASAFRSKD
jgi:hypothetical protein